MRHVLMTARAARRLARKLAKPAALWWLDLQLLVTEARACDCITARAMTVPMKSYELAHRAKLIACRNHIRGW